MTIKLKVIKKFLKKLIWTIGANPLVAFFVLFFLSLVIGGLVFYRYGFLAEKAQIQIIETPLQFEKDLFEEISQEWQIRQDRSEEVTFRKFPDLFQSQVTPPQEGL